MATTPTPIEAFRDGWAASRRPSASRDLGRSEGRYAARHGLDPFGAVAGAYADGWCAYAGGQYTTPNEAWGAREPEPETYAHDDWTEQPTEPEPTPTTREERIIACIRALAAEDPYYAPMVAPATTLTIREGKEGNMPRYHWGRFVTIGMLGNDTYRVTLLESTTGEFSPWSY